MVGGEYGFFSRLCTPESEHCRAVKSKSAVPVAGTPVLLLTLSLHTAADGGGVCQEWDPGQDSFRMVGKSRVLSMLVPM